MRFSIFFLVDATGQSQLFPERIFHEANHDLDLQGAGVNSTRVVRVMKPWLGKHIEKISYCNKSQNVIE